jgi:hypothetical protein
LTTTGDVLLSAWDDDERLRTLREVDLVRPVRVEVRRLRDRVELRAGVDADVEVEVGAGLAVVLALVVMVVPSFFRPARLPMMAITAPIPICAASIPSFTDVNAVLSGILITMP